MTLPIVAQSQQQGVEATHEIMGQFCASTAPQICEILCNIMQASLKKNFQEEYFNKDIL